MNIGPSKSNKDTHRNPLAESIHSSIESLQNMSDSLEMLYNMSVKLYKLSVDKWDYDENSEQVIAARNVEEAKSLANLPGAEEGWHIEEIGISNTGTVGVICSCFHAG